MEETGQVRRPVGLKDAPGEGEQSQYGQRQQEKAKTGLVAQKILLKNVFLRERKSISWRKNYETSNSKIRSVS